MQVHSTHHKHPIPSYITRDTHIRKPKRKPTTPTRILTRIRPHRRPLRRKRRVRQSDLRPRPALRTKRRERRRNASERPGVGEARTGETTADLRLWKIVRVGAIAGQGGGLILEEEGGGGILGTFDGAGVLWVSNCCMGEGWNGIRVGREG